MRITAIAPESLPLIVQPEVARSYKEAIAVMQSLGAIIEHAAFPFDLDELSRRNGRIIAAEAYAWHRDYIEDESLDIDPWVRKRTIAGKAISAADYIAELRARQHAGASFSEWMRGREAVLTPTLPIVATPLEEVDESTAPLAMFTRAANYLGTCALSLPAGFDDKGLPVGVQLIGAAFADATLVTVGRAFQAATDWHVRHPDLSVLTAAARRR